jgi:flagellar hook-associated protein 1 FlgK
MFDKALLNTGNNVNNASTPGFAKQRVTTVALPFAPNQGLPGGITTAELESSRDEYAEQAVRQEQYKYSGYQETASDLSRIEGLFDVSGQSGVPSAMSKLFQAFSAWSVAPSDTLPRQQVIDAATGLASSFNDVASELGSASQNLDQQVHDAVSAINDLSSQIRDINVQTQRNLATRSDPSLDARLHETLASLAQYTDFTALRQSDGTVTVLMGGQVPLVNGDKQYALTANSSSAQTTVIRDAQGNDVTAQATTGKLGALMEMRNTTLPSYVSDLNRLAAGLADGINATLAAGVDANGNAGAALFAYNSASDAASSLRVTSITTAELAAATPDKPGGNGNALNLTELANQPELDGLAYTAFYGQLATQVGQALDSAKANQDTHEQLLLQARSMRDDISGVSLDEEAAKLLEFQRAYEATAQFITVLNQLTQDVLNILPL